MGNEDTTEEQLKLTGVYDTVQEAFGDELWAAIHSDEASRVEPPEDSELNSESRRLIAAWNGEARRFLDPNTKEEKLFLEKELMIENGSSGIKPRVAVIVSGPMSKNEPGCDSWRAEKMVHSHTRAVDFQEYNGITPVTLVMDVPIGKDVDTGDTASENSGSGNFCRPIQNGFEIHFPPINSVVGVYSQWHEAGHAIQVLGMSPEESEKHYKGISFSKMAGKAYLNLDIDYIRELEAYFGMTWEEARFINVQSERNASLIGSSRIKDSNLFGDSTPVYYQESCHNAEMAWRTYDSLPIGTEHASDYAKALESSGKLEIWRDHQILLDRIRELSVQLGVKEEKGLIFVNPAGDLVKFEDNGGGMFIFTTRGSQNSCLIVNPVALSYSVYDKKFEHPEETEYSLIGIEEIANVDREAVRVGLEELSAKGSELNGKLISEMRSAAKKEDFLHGTFYDLFPELWEEVYPHPVSLSERIETEAQRLKTTQEINHGNSITNLQEKHQALTQAVVEKSGDVAILNGNFNQWTGEQIRDEGDRFVIACESYLVGKGLADEIPNRYEEELYREERERGVLEMTANVLAQEAEVEFKGKVAEIGEVTSIDIPSEVTEADAGLRSEVTVIEQETQQKPIRTILVPTGNSNYQQEGLESPEEKEDLELAFSLLRGLRQAKGKTTDQVDRLQELTGIKPSTTYIASNSERAQIVDDLNAAAKQAEQQGLDALAGKVRTINEQLAGP